MLRHISIKNLALIRELEVDFSPELNVFSGETGAGKSIIVDSLMLLVGARYDRSLLKYGEDSGYVEGVFDYSDATPLENAGIDCEDGFFIVKRKFFRDGKNEIRINGKQITTAMLRELMQHYVDIYGQNEYQSLLKISEQQKILDHFVFGKDSAPLKVNAELFDSYKKLCSELSSLGNESERAQRIDVLKFRIDEISSADVKEGEEDALVERRHILMSAERIKNSLAAALDVLDGESGACQSASEALHSMAQLSSLGENFSSLHDRLRSVGIELDDIAETVRDELGGMEGSERELDAINARLDKLRSLKSKYGAYAAMQKFLLDCKAELSRLENGADLYAELSEKEKKLRDELLKSCETLSAMRKNGARMLKEKILSELADLGMANSDFDTVFAPHCEDVINSVTRSGYDEIEFFLSPNVGQPLLPLAKIISGGEMSRFMLAVKLITGDLGNIDTMIFDEIDAGISGQTGQCVAKKLAQLSRGKQVLCVTHLAQIASMADGHYFIEKSDVGGDTATSVTALDRAGMIKEISRLSGTQGVSQVSDSNAAELKDWGDSFKRSIA